MKKKFPDKSTLEHLYVHQRIDAHEIAIKFDVNRATVHRWIRTYGIRRPPKPTKEILDALYHDKKISPEKIAEIYHVSGRTVRNWMNEYGIDRLGATHLRIGKSATWNVGKKHTEAHREKNRLANIGRTPHNKGNGDVSFVCEVCGCQVSDKPYRKKRTCSYECRSLLSHINRGKEHWNYKGNVTNRLQRLWAETHEWRKEILEKANYNCQKCGKHGGDLQAHHIYSWAEYPELRTDINNGACLCARCHREFHKLYGTRKSLHNEFTMWIGQPASTD